MKISKHDRKEIRRLKEFQMEFPFGAGFTGQMVKITLEEYIMLRDRAKLWAKLWLFAKDSRCSYDPGSRDTIAIGQKALELAGLEEKLPAPAEERKNAAD